VQSNSVFGKEEEEKEGEEEEEERRDTEKQSTIWQLSGSLLLQCIFMLLYRILKFSDSVSDYFFLIYIIFNVRVTIDVIVGKFSIVYHL